MFWLLAGCTGLMALLCLGFGVAGLYRQSADWAKASEKAHTRQFRGHKPVRKPNLRWPLRLIGASFVLVVVAILFCLIAGAG